MTDYASQGRTRTCNVVDINSSRDFRAVYTSLSRSSSAAGTLIFQGFNSDVISGGLKNGGYRQELRELELLDEITRLRYLGQLPASTPNETRSFILKHFRSIKGAYYLPPKIHPAVAWSENNAFDISKEPEMTWRIISKDENENKPPNAYKQGNFNPTKVTPRVVFSSQLSSPIFLTSKAIYKNGNLFAHSSAARPHILVNNKPLQRLKLDNEVLEPAWLSMMSGSDSPFSGDSDFNWQYIYMGWRMIFSNIRAP
ncbi:hypothetical protein K435DRAFT_870084 [Dendrothele bispora CBS 962.96]|uniref:Uncharacterized protein n=1 Tax=Dendrothele bispora (strain CBS 962.96) TaxID=1314807 RepID=A0A4V4HCU2_DENBC|nr:hypothetical protein K435DRAFT_870084 [Dendrothele bispora CBS 962.96]